MINLNKINNWEYIKGKQLWVNVKFDEPKQINNSEQISFSTLSLNDLLDFSVNLIDDRNNLIEFNCGEKEISILNFKIEVVFKMKRKSRPTNSAQIKDEQIGLILEEIEQDNKNFKKSNI